jgi:succinate dehydrogenase / fumarate reductase cytochrome b subunit
MRLHGGYLFSSIGRKQLVGLTGLGLSLFVLVHVSGNFLIFSGPEAYNLYSHALTSNHLIYLAEAGLLGLFILHLLTATWLSINNWLARPQAYAMSASGDKRTTLTTKTLWYQGVVILIFVVYHLYTFKFGPYYEATYQGLTVRDLHRLVIEVFHDTFHVVFYSVCLLVLGLHLSHGVSSSLQTLGFNHPKYNCKIKLIGRIFAWFVAFGFLSQPLYVFFCH